MVSVNSSYIEAKFISIDKNYQSPNDVLSLETSIDHNGLNLILNSLLLKDSDESVAFNFFIKGKSIDSVLSDLYDIKEKKEQIINIEFKSKFVVPKSVLSIKHNDWIKTVDFNGQHIITGSFDNKVYVWDLKGNLNKTFKGHNLPVNKVLYTKMGNVLSCCQGRKIYLWNNTLIPTESKDENLCLKSFHGHSESVQDMCLSPSKNLFCSVSNDKTLKLWQLEEDNNHLSKKSTIETPIKTFQWEKSGLECCLWLNNYIITGGWDHCLHQWDPDSGTVINSRHGKHVITSLDYNKSTNNHNVIIGGCLDRFIYVWDLRAKENIVKTIINFDYKSPVTTIDWSSEYLITAGAYNGVVSIWDIREGSKSVSMLTQQKKKIFCVKTINEYTFVGGETGTLSSFKNVF